MTVLVTGAAGLIGGQVAELLRARGDAVVGFDLRRPADERLRDLPFVTGDVNDHPRLFGVVARNRVRKIVHAGAISAPHIAPDNPFLVCRVNILGTLNVYEAARLFDDERVVNFGSISGYGDVAAGTIDEATPFAPTSVYGATKAAADMLGSTYALEHGLDVVSLRPTLVYGPRRPSYEPVREAIRGALERRPVRLPASPNQPHAPVYGADVARAVVAALDADRLARRAYNVAGPDRTTLAEAIALVARLVGPVDVSYEHDEPAAATADFDASAFERYLGVSPEWPLERAIPDYAAWLRQHDV